MLGWVMDARVHVVAREGDRRPQPSVGDGVVDGEGQAVALAVAEPGDPSGQALAGDVLAGQADPVGDAVGAVKQLEAELVDGGQVAVLARQADPPERPDARGRTAAGGSGR